MLNKRTPKEIQTLPKLLLGSDVSQVSASGEALTQLETEFGLDAKGLDMIFLALPDATPQAVYQAPVAVAVTAPARSSGTSVRKLEYGVCNITYANLSDSSQAERDALAASPNGMGPKGEAFAVWSRKRYQEFFGIDRGQAKDFDWLAKWEKSLKVSVLRAPAHGKLTQVDQDSEMLITPDVDYIGKDRVDLLVTGKDDLGRPFALTLRYYINVVGREFGPGLNAIKHPDSKELCGTVKNRWRISGVDSEGAAYVTLDAGNFTAWLQSAQLSALLASASQSLTAYQNLSGTAVGETVGEGSSAQITLDTTAAGHGWYIDPNFSLDGAVYAMPNKPMQQTVQQRRFAPLLSGR